MFKLLIRIVLIVGVLAPYCMYAQTSLQTGSGTPSISGYNMNVPEFGISLHVPNTNIAIVPPEHFLISEKLPGFIHAGTSTSIQISEIYGTSYVMLSNSLTKEELKKQGFNLVKTEEVTLKNQTTGVIYQLKYKSDKVDYTKVMLFAGDYNNTIWINASYPSISHVVVYEKIKESLLTAHFNEAYEK